MNILNMLMILLWPLKGHVNVNSSAKKVVLEKVLKYLHYFSSQMHGIPSICGFPGNYNGVVSFLWIYQQFLLEAFSSTSLCFGF